MEKIENKSIVPVQQLSSDVSMSHRWRLTRQLNLRSCLIPSFSLFSYISRSHWLSVCTREQYLFCRHNFPSSLHHIGADGFLYRRLPKSRRRDGCSRVTHTAEAFVVWQTLCFIETLMRSTKLKRHTHTQLEVCWLLSDRLVNFPSARLGAGWCGGSYFSFMGGGMGWEAIYRRQRYWRNLPPASVSAPL
jgi:hypothetical protein